MNNINDRKIALDIETTGLNETGILYENHRIIEIGAVEIINRRLTNNKFHVYLNPRRSINIEAFKIHGISSDYLAKKPYFSEIYPNFIRYISNSDIIAHNANFDVSFLNYEIKKLNLSNKNIDEFCKIIDTLDMARKFFPGKKNNLDALCNRYSINISNRVLHSAVVDATLVAKLYLRMTSIQKEISLNNYSNKNNNETTLVKSNSSPLKVLLASLNEKKKHMEYLEDMKNSSKCLWKK